MEEISAKIFGVELYHPHFSYLAREQYNEIMCEINAGKSHTVAFISNVRGHIASAVVTIEDEKIHIRECGGAFIDIRHELEKYVTALASASGRKKISLCAREKIRDLAIEKHGFKFFADNEVHKDLV